MKLMDCDVYNNLSIKPVNLSVQYKTDGTPYIFYEGELTAPNGSIFKIIIPCLEMKFNQLSVLFSQTPKIIGSDSYKCYLHPSEWNGTTIHFLIETEDELFDWSN